MVYTASWLQTLNTKEQVCESITSSGLIRLQSTCWRFPLGVHLTHTVGFYSAVEYLERHSSRENVQDQVVVAALQISYLAN